MTTDYYFSQCQDIIDRIHRHTTDYSFSAHFNAEHAPPEVGILRVQEEQAVITSVSGCNSLVIDNVELSQQCRSIPFFHKVKSTAKRLDNSLVVTNLTYCSIYCGHSVMMVLVDLGLNTFLAQRSFPLRSLLLKL